MRRLRARRALVSCILLALATVGLTSGAAAQTTGTAVTASFSGLVLNRATRNYSSVLTLTNTGPTLYAPLTILISTGTPAVTVAGASSDGGNTFGTTVIPPNGSLLPGESQSLVVAFANPSRASFTPTVSSVTGAPAPAGLGITVTSPTAGSTPAGPTFVVFGSLSAPSAAGASLDGVPACVLGNSFFYVNAFRPQTSLSSFVATAIDIDGGHNSVPISIAPNPKGLRVVPSPACGGVAPLTTTVNVALDAPDGDSIVSETIDFGTGAGPSRVTPGTPAENIYTAAGFYQVQVTAVTAMGQTLQQIALVPALTPAQAFAPVQATATLLQSALNSGNAVRAASLFSASSQSRYQSAFVTLGAQMPTAAGYLSALTPLSIGPGTSQAAFNATVGGVSGALTIEFAQDLSGIWRVESW